MVYIPTKTVLIRQEEVADGKKKDVMSKKGVKIELSDREAIKFWGALDLNDKDKKRLMAVAKANGYKRTL